VVAFDFGIMQTIRARAAEKQALVAARLGKQKEIEKQLALLAQYKEQMPEEEYNEKVVLLLACLPAADTYDKFTKTELPVKEEPEEEKQEEEGWAEFEEEPQGKKGFGGQMMAAMGSAASKAKKAVTGSKEGGAEYASEGEVDELRTEEALENI
jgi:hypothetical protein